MNKLENEKEKGKVKKSVEWNERKTQGRRENKERVTDWLNEREEGKGRSRGKVKERRGEGQGKR